MTNIDWTMVGAIAGVIAVLIAIIALVRRARPSQTSGERGVNVGGNANAPINTGSQTTRKE